MKSVTSNILLAGAATAATILKPRQGFDDTAVVDLAEQLGAPQHLASGFIYGIPDSPANQYQIPDEFYTGIDFQYGRAGGAQLPAPCRGWIWGYDEYKCRFESALQNYQTSRKYGAHFILLPHDVWGTDHANSSTVWPGDNGDFSNYEQFLNQLMSDINANNMQDALVWDIWNEADGGFFGGRPVQQWINLWDVTYQAIRSNAAMDEVLISGPSHANQPDPTDVWWWLWLEQIKGNNTIPDQYSWHIEGNPSDPEDDLQTNNATLTQLLLNNGMAQPKQVNINEYGVPEEQQPAGSAWWIARLERYQALGLRGNWLSNYELHDLQANLLSKPNANNSNYDYEATGYYPNGQWQTYAYYAQNMTGQRVATYGSGDRILDVYGTAGTDKVRVLCGVRLQTGTWYLTIDNLSAVGLPKDGNLPIHTYGFIQNGNEYSEVDAPTDRGSYTHSYSGDSVTFAIYQTEQDANTAWAFEFDVPQ